MGFVGWIWTEITSEYMKMFGISISKAKMRVVTFLAYALYTATNAHAQAFTNTTSLDSSTPGLEMQWQSDASNSRVTFRICKPASVAGWVGIGFNAAAGQMVNSDVFYAVQESAVWTVKDGRTTSKSSPAAAASTFTLQGIKEIGESECGTGNSGVEFSSLYEGEMKGDSNGLTNVIAAWHTTSTSMSFHRGFNVSLASIYGD